MGPMPGAASSVQPSSITLTATASGLACGHVLGTWPIAVEKDGFIDDDMNDGCSPSQMFEHFVRCYHKIEHLGRVRILFEQRCSIILVSECTVRYAAETHIGL
jgi:hypothetical protein